MLRRCCAVDFRRSYSHIRALGSHPSTYLGRDAISSALGQVSILSKLPRIYTESYVGLPGMDWTSTFRQAGSSAIPAPGRTPSISPDYVGGVRRRRNVTIPVARLGSKQCWSQCVCTDVGQACKATAEPAGRTTAMLSYVAYIEIKKKIQKTLHCRSQSLRKAVLRSSLASYSHSSRCLELTCVNARVFSILTDFITFWQPNLLKGSRKAVRGAGSVEYRFVTASW